MARGRSTRAGRALSHSRNWPGKINAGIAVDQPIHVVDMYPTLAGRAGAALTKTKPLDGVDVWSTISTAQPSPRERSGLQH